MNGVTAKRGCLVAGLVLTLLASSCGTGDPGSSLYPLSVSPNGRYLVDGRGDPFLVVGDAPQSLMINGSLADARLLFANRVSHGINTVWIALIGNDYDGGRADATTFDGVAPFTTPGDLSTPNEAYFARCDQVIQAAADEGLNVILNPAETGGFMAMLRANGAAKCREYGRYVGSRYKNFDNIVWMSGTDFQTWRTDADNEIVKALAEGIRERDTRHVQTLQLDYFVSSSLDDGLWAGLVTLNAAYTYYPAYAEVLKDYAHDPAVPVFVIESDYELENGSDAERLRRQEYWTYLSGGCGYVFGHGFIWPLGLGWEDDLDSIGMVEFSHCASLFRSLPWYSLVPDRAQSLVTAGYGTYWSGGTPSYGISQNDYATAAATPDGTLALVYVPTARTITVDMARLSGPVTGRWFDPTAGTYQTIGGSPFAASGPRTFTTPGVHADGASDWVLRLDKE